MAEMRPLIVAEPMLRAPRPETTALSNTGAAPAPTEGGATGSGADACGSATTTLFTLAPAAGKRNIASSTSTLTSTRSTVWKASRGASLRPPADENDIHTPATCS